MKHTFFLSKSCNPNESFYECPTEDFAICDRAIKSACPMAPNNIEVTFVTERPHRAGWVQVKLGVDGKFYIGKDTYGYAKLYCQYSRMPRSDVVWMRISY
jgi:hypothetical protein